MSRWPHDRSHPEGQSGHGRGNDRRVDWWTTGHALAAGQVMYRLETDKVEMDVEAPVAGVIHISVPAGSTYTVGATVATSSTEQENRGTVNDRLRTATTEGVDMLIKGTARRTSGALCHDPPGPGAGAALLRCRLLRHGGGAAVAPRMADGLPAGGDPRAGRLRRVRDPRPVRHRGRVAPDMTVKAYYNACRHRGVKLVEGRGSCPSGFVCPFHGWCWGLDGANTFLYQPDLFAEHNRRPDDLSLAPVRCELWGGCAWINMDDNAPPLPRNHRAVRLGPRRLEGGVAAGRVVAVLPAAGQLEAGHGGVHGGLPRHGNPSAAESPRDPERRQKPSTGSWIRPHRLSAASDGRAYSAGADDRLGTCIDRTFTSCAS